MERRGFLAIVAVLVVIAAVSAGIVLAVVGIGVAGFEDLTDDSSQPPALLAFESSGAQCAERFRANSSSSVVAGGSTTEITYARNVSLPGPSYAIGGPTFERLNESTYVLDIPIENTDKASRECPGVARYNGTMRIPAGDNPWYLIIKHDGEMVTTLYGDSHTAVLGGSASVGQSVSAPDRTPTSTRAAE